MKKFVIVFSALLCLLLTCTAPLITVTTDKYLLTSDDVATSRSLCTNNDSIVTIVNSQNEIKSSGIIMYKTGYEYYIATTYDVYNTNYNYEIIFSDYSRYESSVLGYSKEDGVLLLKSIVRDSSYCVANTSGNLKSYTGEKVNVLSRKDYNPAMNQTFVSAVGICKNCGEETFKNYFYSRLTLEIDEEYLGAGVFNLNNQLVGMLAYYLEDYKYGVAFVDSNRILDMITKYVFKGEYNKNYIKYNLLNVSDLTEKEKYLYSVSDGVTRGVLVSSLHYVNYFTLGLNQGMVILSVNGEDVNNVYEFDYEISKYKKGSYLDLKVRTIIGLYRTIKVKI